MGLAPAVALGVAFDVVSGKRVLLLVCQVAACAAAAAAGAVLEGAAWQDTGKTSCRPRQTKVRRMRARQTGSEQTSVTEMQASGRGASVVVGSSVYARIGRVCMSVCLSE